MKKAVIRAEAHSDDHHVQVEFDAVHWFEQASDSEIADLARCDWGGDYPADAVAEFFDRTGKNSTSRLFRYLEAIADDRSKKDVSGFECHVNRADAIQWVKAHRHPALVAEVANEGE